MKDTYSKNEVQALLRSKRYVSTDSKGGIPLTAMTDTQANKSTLYYSTTRNKVVWKDADGNVQDLY